MSGSVLRVTGASAVWSPGWEESTVTSTTSLTCVDGEVVERGEPTTTTSPALETLDARGGVITPGLVNAHHHLLQSAFRTLPGTRGVAMAEWLGVMRAAYASAPVDPELVFTAARVALAESLLCGVTTVGDHHLTWPAGLDPVQVAGAAFGAAESVGARLAFVRGTAGDDPDAAADSVEAIVAAHLPDAGARGAGVRGAGARGAGGVSADGFRQLAVGPSGVHADGPETFAALREVAARHGLRRRTQSNEQVDVERAARDYGRRPLHLLDEWGWLQPDVTLAHLCDVTPDEVALLARRGVTATHAPACDLPMGWGIAPVAALLDAGVRVGLGTSGGGSNDAGHLLADARLAMQVAPLVGRPLDALEVLTMATAGSADGLGRPELGRLDPGCAADLVVWDVSGVADAGVADPVRGLLWASPGRRPRHVVVGGRVVVRDYELVTADEYVIATELRRIAP
ncbi:amidohydrolase family protein [Rhodococcus sp. IEGM 1408]|uniref:amidohydrolase family protein n=1 Tax=Rhodococcus sp. IEGM 1408 TaxID=3082220 RepID=UPI002955B579|nr:amidohydrolase family protein [Rhodococcus sp. IEGM 1408]MDV8001496.1 amidohydrolase family protein [Rhodococcus sp. IEGM 1408]